MANIYTQRVRARREGRKISAPKGFRVDYSGVIDSLKKRASEAEEAARDAERLFRRTRDYEYRAIADLENRRARGLHEKATMLRY